MSNDDHTPPAPLEHTGLRPHEDARAIVRLFQCSQCSYPLREPMTLPCGNSICRPCVPPLYPRTNITYPQNAARSQGFVCPFRDCGMEHSLADCSLDITLNKMMGLVASQMSAYMSKSTDTALQLDEKLHWQTVVESAMDVMPRSRVLKGGRVVGAFTLASMGELNYHSELAFSPVQSASEDSVRASDVAVVGTIKDIVRSELECQVCYGLMLDPLTTTCGHTFCRKCVARVLDHSNLCPVCRRPLSMRPGVLNEPTNKRIQHLLSNIFTEDLATRLRMTRQEEAFDEDGWMSLFPCTLAYPLMPTFLHIFEPRYRLMVRRAIESGGRKFGMLMYNSRRQPQGALGRSTFMQYGTVLHIQRLEMFQDGRSLLETQGVYRFKVLEASMHDGYNTGRIQRIDDMSLAEEEALEASETSGPEPAVDDVEGRITHMSTQALLQHGLDFITRARARSAPWLHERVLAAYGQPSTDPAIFPYWFASVLPLSDDEKYMLLPTTSVRERLKMTARWIQRLEAARCLFEAAHAELMRQHSNSNTDEEEEEEQEVDESSDAAPGERANDTSQSDDGQLATPEASSSSTESEEPAAQDQSTNN